jgi:hypothetical protein
MNMSQQISKHTPTTLGASQQPRLNDHITTPKEKGIPHFLQ